MSNTKISLKLLIDKKSRKVLFAETGKDFVDFLFNILALPIGSVIKLITDKAMVGCIGNLYKSVEDLNDIYIMSNQKKDTLLKPTVPKTSISNVPLLLSTPDTDANSPVKKFYNCPNNHRYVADVTNVVNCPACRYTMSTEVQFVSSGTSKSVVEASSSTQGGGFVKELIMYMVMDDLTVIPMSMISGIAALNKCNVKDFDALEEMMVDFGMDEGLKLLEASFQSKAALTQVFLVKDESKDIAVSA